MLKSVTTRGAIFTWLVWTAVLGSCGGSQSLGYPDAVLGRDAGSGTDSDADADNDNDTDATAACVGSLQEVGAWCPATFDGTAEQLPPCPPPLVQSVLACPDLLVLAVGGGYGGSECFYDSSSHVLVGASNGTDTQSYCGNSFTQSAGKTVDTVACTATLTPPVRKCADFTCTYQGVPHAVGDEFTSGDGCQRCTCNTNFTVSCEVPICADAGGRGD